jgi:hypothetical protein
LYYRHCAAHDCASLGKSFVLRNPSSAVMSGTNNGKYIYSPVKSAVRPLARNVFKQYATPCPLFRIPILPAFSQKLPLHFASVKGRKAEFRTVATHTRLLRYTTSV